MASRKRLQEEIEQQLADAVSELASALQRFKGGQRSAISTVGANLRLLLGPGRGDSLLWRVAEAKGQEIIPVWQSQTPQALQLALGDLVEAFGPSFYDSAQDAPKGAIEVPLQKALDGRCFMVRNPDTGKAEELTWLGMIVMVADKLAVHADEEIPAVLDKLGQLIMYGGQAVGYDYAMQKGARVVVPRGHAVVGTSMTG